MRKKWIGTVLLFLTALVVISRLRTYHEPYERDITWYAVAGHEIIHGKKYYTELWAPRTPLLSLIYAGAELIFGYGPGAIYFLNVSMALLTLFGIFFAVSWASQTTSAGLLAAFLWSVFGNDLYLQANQPNTEVFMNACLIWGFALLVKMKVETDDWGEALIVGLLFGLATLFKHVAIAPILLMGGAHLMFSRQDGRTLYKGLRQLTIIGLSIAGVWGMMISYFFMTHRWREFIECVFTYNQFYATHGFVQSSLLGNIVASFTKDSFHWFTSPQPLVMLAVLAIIGIAGFFFDQRRGLKRSWVLWLSYLGGAYIAMALPGFFHPHYYQLLLPPLIVGASLSISCFAEAPQHYRWYSAAFGILAAGLVALEIPFYFLSAQEWSFKKYGREFLVTQMVGRQIDRYLLPGETFYAWTTDPGLYFWSRRRAPTIGISCWPLIYGPLSERLNQQVIAELGREKPELFIGDRHYMPAPGTAQPVMDWVMQHYERVPGFSDRGDFLLLVWRGGELQKRLQK